MSHPISQPAESAPSEPPPILIALPKGAILSGITSWASVLARGLAPLGHRVMLLVHGTPAAPDAGPLSSLVELPGVEVRVLAGTPPIDDAIPEPRPELPEYLRAIADLGGSAATPVIAVPTYSAECFGLFAEASRRVPGAVRTLGWMHSDIPYDRLTLSHYAPLIHRFIGVSSEIVATLRRAMPERDGEVVRIPYGVVVPPVPAPRQPGPLATPARPLRLIYTGRMDLEQKRVHALIDMSRELESLAITHELTLVGDGPAAGTIDTMIAGSANVRRVTTRPHEVGDWLDRADVFVLASRYEGLSVSMLEAMAHACVPVVTRVSGAEDALGTSDADRRGTIVDAGPGINEPELGAHMARGVVEALRTGIIRLSERARHRAAAEFSAAGMARAVSVLCTEIASEPPRRWPEGRPSIAGDFTVPADAVERAARVLTTLKGLRVALWGAGRHTRAIARAMNHAPGSVVAVLDDNAGTPGERLAPWPIVGHAGLPDLGVTDVVISSALHEPALWARREELERTGIRVHRLYPDTAP